MIVLKSREPQISLEVKHAKEKIEDGPLHGNRSYFIHRGLWVR